MVLAAVCCAAAAAPKQAEPIDVWLRAGVDIDAQGRVTDLQWQEQTRVHALMAERLSPIVREWEFEPATAQGQPVATQTGLLVHILADERDDGSVTLRLADARTGPMSIDQAPPTYPVEAAIRDISAVVKVTVEVDADGKPVIREMTFDSSSNGRGSYYRKLFIKSATEAVERWTFRPEIVAGVAVREPVRIPIRYCMEGSKWCERMSADEDANRKLPAGLNMADSSAVALKTEIASIVI